MAERNLATVQWLRGSLTAVESRPGRIGPISLGAKQTGERSAGNLHAAFRLCLCRQNSVSRQQRLWFEETRSDCVIIEQEVRAIDAGGTILPASRLGESLPCMGEPTSIAALTRSGARNASEIAIFFHRMFRQNHLIFSGEKTEAICAEKAWRLMPRNGKRKREDRR